jgi:dTDP-4-amino-4,6-dideoxygalactose transaminase
MINFLQNKSLDYDLLKQVLSESHKNNQFTNGGPAKRTLERLLHELLEIEDSKEVLCVGNGTLALHAIKLFLKKKQGDLRWASPSFTFPSCVVGGFSTNLSDIELETMTLPLSSLEDNDGIIITSLFGTYPPNLQAFVEKCKQQNKKLILDVASSPMTKIKGKNICNFADYSFGSLHHTKLLGFGEGGFIILPKEEYYEMSSVLSFGYTREQKVRLYNGLSSNYKMSDIAASAVIQQLKKINLDLVMEIQNEFISELNNLQNSKLFLFNEGVAYGNLPILFKNPQDKKTFFDQGIDAQKYYYPLSMEHNNSMFVYNRIVNFPLHTDLAPSDINKIINCVKEIG